MNRITKLTAASAFSIMATAANAHDRHDQHHHRGHNDRHHAQPDDKCEDHGKALVLGFAAGLLGAMMEKAPRAQERAIEDTVRDFQDNAARAILAPEC